MRSSLKNAGGLTSEKKTKNCWGKGKGKKEEKPKQARKNSVPFQMKYKTAKAKKGKLFKEHLREERNQGSADWKSKMGSQSITKGPWA